jgi:hypothetical protein
MILNKYELYKTLNHHNSVNIKPREMILSLLESSHYDESNRKEFIKFQSLDIKIMTLNFIRIKFSIASSISILE